jgi:hypothetical protein
MSPAAREPFGKGSLDSPKLFGAPAAGARVGKRIPQWRRTENRNEKGREAMPSGLLLFLRIP